MDKEERYRLALVEISNLPFGNAVVLARSIAKEALGEEEKERTIIPEAPNCFVELNKEDSNYDKLK